jgi:ABC-2 type transport system permease protein
MLSLLKKDVMAFFSSWVGWGIISSFSVLMGIYVWWIEGNVLDFGYAELSVFFDLSPWFFLFFIPALAMNSISEEVDLGTFQLLRSLPISLSQIQIAKLFALIGIVLVTLLPSLLFVYTIASLGFPPNNFDTSLILGGYLALFLLTSVFVFLGVLASSLSKKQPLAFIIGLVLNFIFWQGTKEIGIEVLDLSAHYSRMSMGVLSFSDLSFFFGFLLVLGGLIRIRLGRLI